MEGLRNRQKEKINEEDEAEFLDEEEQEQLLTDLREQNNKANLSIQRGLIVIGFIILALFINILMQKDSPPVIPISQVVSEYPIETVLNAPTVAALTSIVSITTSIFALIMKCKMNVFGLLSFNDEQYATNSGYVAIASALIAPVMSLFSSSSYIELIYWTVPLFVLSMYYAAYFMMDQVQTSLEELENSKYKYKGA